MAPETLSGRERGLRLYETSRIACDMIVRRLTLETSDLPLISLPLCTEEEASWIEGLIPQAKMGLVLSHKAEATTPSELKGLIANTTPKIPQGIWQNLTLRETQNALPEYQHFIATLSLLTKIKQVAFFDFSDPPNQVGYDLGLSQTFWYEDQPSAKQIWQILQDLETAIRASLFQEEPIGSYDLLKLGHFFCAGKEVSKIF